MKFEYNGNLEENKRIMKVANEIINYYSKISLDKAMLIAALEDPITSSITNEMYFKRLYNILFVYQNDENVYIEVFNNIFNLYNTFSNNEHDEKIDLIMKELIDYYNNKRITFPIISEFY